jgi:NAD(P)-dependent dehydrogenase (short-subunit alcohol dehydrogenase family)
MPRARPSVRTALITGAAGGIGHAIALALAGQGWQLLLTDRDASALQTTQRECQALGQAVDVMPVDVTQEADVAAAIQHVVARHGWLDGFVSNAGVPGVVRPIADYPLDAFAQTMTVNATGTFLCLKHALPAMHASGNGGSFVAIGSTSSIRGRAGLAGYVASKHAVLGLVRSAALETVGTPVRVNAVLPGPTQTAMIDAIDAMAGKDAGQVRRAVDAPYGQPADVADTVAFLLSPQARHLNGAALVVDGGSTLA